MKNIAQQTLNLPSEAPVMVLPNAVLFPHALLPLYLFEERYRMMVEFCLQRERMFCVALLKPGHSDSGSDDDYFHVGGLGLIRACVGNPDGTSHLILQGLSRVDMFHLVAEEPFRVAQIRALPSVGAASVESEALAVKVVELCQTLREHGLELPSALIEQLPHLANPEVLSDVLAHTVLTDAFERQALLSELQVVERLRRLITALPHAAGPGEG